MSPFDMFVLVTFVIVSYKATVDAINFWKESEEIAQAHFRAQDAIKNARARNNINPKHVRVPCRPSRVPAHKAQRTAINKTCVVNKRQSRVA